MGDKAVPAEAVVSSTRWEYQDLEDWEGKVVPQGMVGSVVRVVVAELLAAEPMVPAVAWQAAVDMAAVAMDAEAAVGAARAEVALRAGWASNMAAVAVMDLGSVAPAAGGATGQDSAALVALAAVAVMTGTLEGGLARRVTTQKATPVTVVSTMAELPAQEPMAKEGAAGTVPGSMERAGAVNLAWEEEDMLEAARLGSVDEAGHAVVVVRDWARWVASWDLGYTVKVVAEAMDPDYVGSVAAVTTG